MGSRLFQLLMSRKWNYNCILLVLRKQGNRAKMEYVFSCWRGSAALLFKLYGTLRIKVLFVYACICIHLNTNSIIISYFSFNAFDLNANTIWSPSYSAIFPYPYLSATSKHHFIDPMKLALGTWAHVLMHLYVFTEPQFLSKYTGDFVVNA